MLIHIDDPLIRQGLTQADHQGREVFQLRRQTALPDSQIDTILKDFSQYLGRFAEYLADIHRWTRKLHAASSLYHGPNGSSMRSHPIGPSAISSSFNKQASSSVDNLAKSMFCPMNTNS